MTTDWSAKLEERKQQSERDDAYRRFVRGRLTWYAIAALVLATFIYFAV